MSQAADSVWPRISPMATPDQRRRALERLQRSIASGTYAVGAMSVAAAILADHEPPPRADQP